MSDKEKTEPRLLGLIDTARYLGISKQTLYNLVGKDKMRTAVFFLMMLLAGCESTQDRLNQCYEVNRDLVYKINSCTRDLDDKEGALRLCRDDLGRCRNY